VIEKQLHGRCQARKRFVVAMKWLVEDGTGNYVAGVGSFAVPLDIAHLSGGAPERIQALVDTGATYTWVPAPVLERLGIEAHERRPFLLADGREVFYQVGWARAFLGGRSEPTLVVFGDPGAQPLLGVFTLEGFGLAADPVNRRLISVPGLLKLAG
jgi:clan AA aspartic protease